MYFITTIGHLPEGNYRDMGSTRCVGYYENFNDADETVRNNRCDIWETIYDYCMIEKVDDVEKALIKNECYVIEK